MSYIYSIHPSIGVARVGNHPTEFFLAPGSIGGLPIECDSYGNELGGPFTTFKSKNVEFAQIKRQGQKFRVYRYNSDNPNANGEELTLDHADVESIEWTVHLANKKAAWYQFSELKGNLLLGADNSYAAQGVAFRNQQIPDRKTLIIDPGPRNISGKKQSIEIGRDNIPGGYPGNFPIYPKNHCYGKDFEKLGDLKTDNKGHLIVLGGHGYSRGTTVLTGYGGGDDWYDDISDGPVTCTITLKNGESFTLQAWVIVGPPDFAPEIVNISAWDDTMFDVGVRYFNLVPEMYSGQGKEGSWNPHFKANYQRDILPIIHRISQYHWVANVQSMIAFSSNIFDFSDPSEKNQPNREKYFSYFRKPETPAPESRQYTLFSDESIPLMPLNSGSNSVKNINVEKFLALTPTQYFLLEQWANGKFTNDSDYTSYPVNEKNRASIGNVVGLPQSPGIEVTWTTQNPAIYSAPYHIKHRADEDFYQNNGLSPKRDECEEGDGCEPGDLTKRMAIPWQADYYNCSVQSINFTDPNTNKVVDENGSMIPKPPTYYTYWWPPQAPWNVISNFMGVTSDIEYTIQVGNLKALIKEQLKRLPKNVSKTDAELNKLTDEQFEALSNSEMAGKQVNYARGMNSYSQMVNLGWSYLGFIRNQNTGINGEMFPYLVETERDYEMFDYKLVSYQDITHNPDDNDGQFVIISLRPVQERLEIKESLMQKLSQQLQQAKQERKTTLLVQSQEKPIDYLEKSLEESQQTVNSFRSIPVANETRERPRTGMRVRF